MTPGAKYTTYPAANFTAAAKHLHSNYSETAWEDADHSELSWAAGTLSGVIEALGPAIGASEAEERIDSLRASNLSYGEHMARIWRTVFGNAQPLTSNHADIASTIIEGIQDASPEIEITDTMVNDVAMGFFGPSVVYDREKMRSALAYALRTR